MAFLRTVKFPNHPIKPGDEPSVVFFDECAVGVIVADDAVFLDMFEKKDAYVFAKLAVEADEARKLAAMLITAANRIDAEVAKKGGANAH